MIMEQRYVRLRRREPYLFVPVCPTTHLFIGRDECFLPKPEHVLCSQQHLHPSVYGLLRDKQIMVMFKHFVPLIAHIHGFFKQERYPSAQTLFKLGIMLADQA